MIQPHGFHREDGDYPAIVLSAGAAPPPPALAAVRRGLEGAGFEAGLWEGGDRYRSLAAAKNGQGVSVRGAGGLFVHLEISRKLRENGDELRRLAAVLAGEIRAR